MKQTGSAIRLDAVDLRILATLQRDSRITKAALAERVTLSATPCWQRLKRLERAGLIRGYRAELALEKIAGFTTVLVEVILKQHRYEDFERFERAMRETDEIVRCWATGGGIDYLLEVVAADIDAYQRLIDRLLTAEIGIERYFTYVVTRPIKTAAQPPIALVAPGPSGGAA
jgi:Lrp/AsnC family transcriptional regulator of ectoine degradation